MGLFLNKDLGPVSPGVTGRRQDRPEAVQVRGTASKCFGLDHSQDEQSWSVLSKSHDSWCDSDEKAELVPDHLFSSPKVKTSHDQRGNRPTHTGIGAACHDKTLRAAGTAEGSDGEAAPEVRAAEAERIAADYNNALGNMRGAGPSPSLPCELVAPGRLAGYHPGRHEQGDRDVSRCPQRSSGIAIIPSTSMSRAVRGADGTSLSGHPTTRRRSQCLGARHGRKPSKKHRLPSLTF